MKKNLNETLTATEIATICHGKHHGQDFQALDVSTDTRTLKAGDLFVALSGENFCGEDFLPQAQEKGAVAAVVAKEQTINLPQILVQDTLQALVDLAKDRRERSSAIFLAVTGTNGKTSTKEILQKILSQKGQTLATRGNLNNDIGVPLTLLRLRAEDQFAVIEMGANHGGEIKHLTEIVRPDIALITNVSAAHLAGFGSLDGVVKAKREIYENSTGKVVINLDLPVSRTWQEAFKSREQATFSLLNSRATAFASEISPTGDAFTLHFCGKSFPIKWQLQGKHNVTNALAACAAASLVGVTGEQMQKALTGLVLHQSRLSAYSVGRHTIFDDTYNANPASFAAAIDVLCTKENPVLIAGAMGELGENASALHQEVAHLALSRGLTFWAVGEGLAREYLLSPEVRHFPDHESAGEALKVLLQDSHSHTVLLKGSRSSQMERVFSAAGIFFDFIK